MAMTLAKAQAKLDMWLAAEDAVASGQMYRIGTRTLQRADLPEILKMIRYWQGEVERLAAGRGRGARVMRVIPRDL